ncbi:hypothetical protein L5515_003092 [Caenorhabditis briggsae]|uniref:Uncharacterized protein n=1 Tax=Caenorhabditis briggsae TaxID=6238 RepID=A0AAE9JB15_CAEBR|nr:hypothetical protein L5515_003092 [Caenorhabditis briggsae]
MSNPPITMYQRHILAQLIESGLSNDQIINQYRLIYARNQEFLKTWTSSESSESSKMSSGDLVTTSSRIPEPPPKIPVIFRKIDNYDENYDPRRLGILLNLSKKNLGEHVRKWKIAINLTTAELAGRVGVCTTTMSRFMQGSDRISVQMERKILIGCMRIQDHYDFLKHQRRRLLQRLQIAN